MTPEQFLAYRAELGLTTHAALAAALCISEISVKRYATDAQPIPPTVGRLLRALVLLHRSKKLSNLNEMP